MAVKVAFRDLEAMAAAYAATLGADQSALVGAHAYSYGPRSGANFAPPLGSDSVVERHAREHGAGDGTNFSPVIRSYKL